VDGETDDRYRANSGEEMNVVVESRHSVHFSCRMCRFNCNMQPRGTGNAHPTTTDGQTDVLKHRISSKKTRQGIKIKRKRHLEVEIKTKSRNQDCSISTMRMDGWTNGIVPIAEKERMQRFIVGIVYPLAVRYVVLTATCSVTDGWTDGRLAKIKHTKDVLT